MDLLWDVRVSLDLFLGGLGVGAFLVGAVLYYMDAKIYESMIKKAFIITPILVIAGLLLLLTELGRPLNVIKTIYAINPTSFMSIGIFLQSAFVAVGLLIAFSILTKGVESVCAKFVYIGAVLAGLVGLYHGLLLTGISIEPWNNAIPVIFFISSILAGSSLVFLLNLSELDTLLQKFKIPVIINMILTLELAAIFAWVYNLALTTASSKHAYDVLMGSFGLEFWGLSIIVGLLIPLALLTMVILGKTTLKAVALPTFATMVIGSFFLKNLVVYLGQAV
ncbi:NrfD/PsrC family molybdoenzyme membrane anchor subunit [Sulfurospirillum barnesii]|uniref:Formate-dependent nitrite reductase, membrane component n=1 Tax=Sulfurospirillum barnesii (strain ATCC 700032 / DSM 10660 / SES-3) TaxID=760154 RepID=I3Y0G1_SULBS|nr:NrfD/PsrC family molybdoenzyme membrane anchor subunit [Sulfurospirillum barnesii]AFL69685.1 formate-dependent nitrite reductase, membrane component [Sulfurospirillum barnesii SES-3]